MLSNILSDVLANRLPDQAIDPNQAASATNSIRHDAIAGNQPTENNNNVATDARNYMPSMWRPIEKVAGLVKSLITL